MLQFGLELVKKGFIEETYGRTLSHAKERRETVDYNIDAVMSSDDVGIISKMHGDSLNGHRKHSM